MNTVKQEVSKEVKTIATPQNVKLLPTPKAVEPTQEKQKASALAAIEKLTPKAPPTAEERIERSNHFEEVKKRYSHLKEKSNDLKMFEAGNDKLHAKVYLENQAGFKFEVRNSNVIEKVLGTMKAELNVLLEEAKTEVLTFEI